MMEQSAYTDVTAACGKSSVTMMDADNDASGPALCYIRNDLPAPFSGQVTVEALNLLGGKATTLSSMKVSLPAGGGAIGFFCADKSTSVSAGAPNCTTFADLFKSVPDCSHGTQDCVLNVTVADDAKGGKAISRNILPLALPSALRLPTANISHTVQETAGNVEVRLTSSATAMYVWLSTLEQGRFEDNAFVLLPGVEKTVRFMPFAAATTSAKALETSLRVEHLAMYL